MPELIQSMPPTMDRLSPDPILSAIDSYRGAIVDLDRDLRVDARQFAAGWRRLTTEFGLLGVERGQIVVMAVGNGPMFPATLAAILSAGALPLVVHAESPVPELMRIAQRTGARFVVGDDLDESLLTTYDCTCRMLESATWAPTRFAARAEAAGTSTDLPAMPLHPTSGTTGEPKIAVRPGFCAMEEARHYIETLDITADDSILAMTPMSHAYAYGMGTMVPMLCGADIVATRRFNPTRVARALADHRITILPGVPAILEMLLAASCNSLGALRCVLSAGAPLSERVALDFQKRLGHDVRPLYGTTETGGVSIAAGHQVAGCVGAPMNGVEVDVRSESGGSRFETDVGTLRIRSSSMMAGYLDAGRIDTSIVDDGWFAPGDLGRIDSAGAIHLKGREADVINVYGLKVVPLEVEEVLAAMPGIDDVKVYAGRRGNGDTFVKAAVVAPQLDVPAIHAYCERQLVYYKRPEVIALTVALPRTPTGKIIRTRLP